MKHVTSIGYRRPRESEGPGPAPGLNRGQPFEPCGPWVPAFAGMTVKRLVLRKSLCFELKQSCIAFARQAPLAIAYKGIRLDCGCRLDTMVVERSREADGA